MDPPCFWIPGVTAPSLIRHIDGYSYKTDVQLCRKNIVRNHAKHSTIRFHTCVLTQRNCWYPRFPNYFWIYVACLNIVRHIPSLTWIKTPLHHESTWISERLLETWMGTRQIQIPNYQSFRNVRCSLLNVTTPLLMVVMSKSSYPASVLMGCHWPRRDGGLMSCSLLVFNAELHCLWSIDTDTFFIWRQARAICCPRRPPFFSVCLTFHLGNNGYCTRLVFLIIE